MNNSLIILIKLKATIAITIKYVSFTLDLRRFLDFLMQFITSIAKSSQKRLKCVSQRLKKLYFYFTNVYVRFDALLKSELIHNGLYLRLSDNSIGSGFFEQTEISRTG